MDFGGGTEAINLSGCYDRSRSVSNYQGSRRIERSTLFNTAGSRNLTFTASDNLGHSREVRLSVNIIN